MRAVQLFDRFYISDFSWSISWRFVLKVWNVCLCNLIWNLLRKHFSIRFSLFLEISKSNLTKLTNWSYNSFECYLNLLLLSFLQGKDWLVRIFLLFTWCRRGFRLCFWYWVTFIGRWIEIFEWVWWGEKLHLEGFNRLECLNRLKLVIPLLVFFKLSILEVNLSRWIKKFTTKLKLKTAGTFSIDSLKFYAKKKLQAKFNLVNW